MSILFIERDLLMTNTSLLIANMTRDMSHYSGSPSWIVRYNQAIWLSQSGQYIEAKDTLSPLINDTTLSKKSDIAELYGDLIYHSSGSLDDTLRMYERSLTFAPSDRVTEKITYIKNISKKKVSGSGTTEKSPKIDSGSLIREEKKLELQAISQKRDEYLTTGIPKTSLKSEIQRLIQSSQS